MVPEAWLSCAAAEQLFGLYTEFAKDVRAHATTHCISMWLGMLLKVSHLSSSHCVHVSSGCAIWRQGGHVLCCAVLCCSAGFFTGRKKESMFAVRSRHCCILWVQTAQHVAGPLLHRHPCILDHRAHCCMPFLAFLLIHLDEEGSGTFGDQHARHFNCTLNH